MTEHTQEVEKVAEQLAMEIVHSEQGHYEPVYKRVLANLTRLTQEAEARGYERANRSKYVQNLVQEAEARGYEKAEAECHESREILWNRMKKLNDEWRAENPKERALTNNDALKLMEWKLEKEYMRGRADEAARRDGIEHAIEQSIIDQHVTMARAEERKKVLSEVRTAVENDRPYGRAKECVYAILDSFTN